jgi:hypothetical protein
VSKMPLRNRMHFLIPLSFAKSTYAAERPVRIDPLPKTSTIDFQTTGLEYPVILDRKIALSLRGEVIASRTYSNRQRPASIAHR